MILIGIVLSIVLIISGAIVGCILGLYQLRRFEQQEGIKWLKH